MDPSGVLGAWGGWFPAFVLTCVIEVPVYLLMFEALRLTRPTDLPTDLPADLPAELPAGGPGPALTWRGAVALVLAVNLLTHPVFWAAALHLASTNGPSTLGLVLGELIVALVEGLVVFAVIRRRPFACLASAIVANAASAVLGSALFGLVTAWAS